MVEDKVYYRSKGRIDEDGTSGRMESGHDPEPSEDRGREGNPVQQPGDPKRVDSR